MAKQENYSEIDYLKMVADKAEDPTQIFDVAVEMQHEIFEAGEIGLAEAFSFDAMQIYHGAVARREELRQRLAA